MGQANTLPFGCPAHRGRPAIGPLLHLVVDVHDAENREGV